MAFKSFELLAHIGLEFRGALDELEPLHLFDRRDGRAERDGMRFVGVAVREVVILEVVGDLLRGGAEAERHIGRGDALGGDQDVGLDAPVIDGKPLAGAAPPGHHFIGDHQHAVAVADFAQARKVFRRRNENAVGSDDRLKNDRRDIAFVADHVLDVVGAGDVAAGIGVLDGTVVAVGLRREDNACAFAARLHGPAARVARGRNRAHRRAVIGAVARNDLGLAGKHARDFEGRFVGFGPAGGEEELLEPRGQHFKQLGAQPGAGWWHIRAQRRPVRAPARRWLPRRADSCGPGSRT